VNVQNIVRWISWSLSIDDFWDSLEKHLYIMLALNLRYLGFWLIMVLKLILLELMWEIEIGWINEKCWSFEMIDFSLTTSHINIHLSFFKYLKIGLSSISSFIINCEILYLIFRMDILLSCIHHLTIKMRLQRCWWKLELIHSWEIVMWDQFPVFPFLFHFVG